MYMLLKDVKHYQTKDSEIYTTKVVYNKHSLDVTYNPTRQNTLIHQWYLLTEEEIEKINQFIKRAFSQLPLNFSIKC